MRGIAATFTIHTISFFIVSLLCVYSLAVPGRAAEAIGDKALPVCALVPDQALDFDQSPLFALFEARLAQGNKVKLLERAEIGRILNEQKLALLLSPEGGKERVATGKILNADVLVLLKAAETVDADKRKVRSVRVVISETKGGLRLVMGTLPWTADAEVDERVLLGLFERGLTKYAEQITDICAVPALVSQNVTHHLDYLGGGYAALIKQGLLQQKGLVVVELTEAQAIADELALTGGGSVIRKAPLFLIGEYRHTGQGEEQRVNIRLVLRSGAAEVQAVNKEGLQATQVGPWLLDSAGKLLAAASGMPAPVLDAEQQAAQLVAEATTLRQAGQWGDALNLMEASLLLKPDQPRLLFEAAAMSARTAIQVRASQLRPRDIAVFRYDARKVLSGYLRVRDYLDAFQHITGAIDLDPFYTDEQQNFSGLSFQLGAFLSAMVRETPEQQELIADYRQAIRDDMDRLFKEFDKDLSDLNGNRFFIFPALATRIEQCCRLCDLPSREQYALRLRALKMMQGIPLHEYYIALYTGTNFQDNVIKEEQASPEFAEFLTRLNEMGGPRYIALADFMRTASKQFQKSVNIPFPSEVAAQPKPPAPATPTGPQEPTAPATFTLMPVKVVRPDGTQELPPRMIGGCVPCGEGIDAMHGFHELFLMKNKGTLHSVYRLPSNHLFQSMAYDGKWLWVLTLPQRRGNIDMTKLPPVTVLAIDPVSEKIISFTDIDGIPPSLALRGTPWKTGALLLAGNSGKGWIALVSVDAAGKKGVDLFFEARTYPDPAHFNVEGPVEPDYAFQPSYLYKVNNLASGGDLFVMGRVFPYDEGHVLKVCPYPLFIDPVKRTAVTNTHTILRETPNPGAGQPELYLWEEDGKYCIGANADKQLKRISLKQDIQNYGLLYAQKRVHFYGLRSRSLWVSDSLDGTYRQVDLKANFADDITLDALSPSHHYGLLLLTTKGVISDFYQVEIGKLPAP